MLERHLLTRQVVLPVSSLLAAAALIAGCSKKADQAPAPAPAATAETAPAGAPAAQPAEAAAQAPQAPTGPVLDASQMQGDAKSAMAEADAALRQREYEKAVRTMLAIQQANLNAQQAALARQQMINLQKNLANAIANGDQNAMNAAQILRASHSR